MLFCPVEEYERREHDEEPSDDPGEGERKPQDIRSDAGDGGIHGPDESNARRGDHAHEQTHAAAFRGLLKRRKDEARGKIIGSVRHGEGRVDSVVRCVHGAPAQQSRGSWLQSSRYGRIGRRGRVGPGFDERGRRIEPGGRMRGRSTGLGSHVVGVPALSAGIDDGRQENQGDESGEKSKRPGERGAFHESVVQFVSSRAPLTPDSIGQRRRRTNRTSIFPTRFILCLRASPSRIHAVTGRPGREGIRKADLHVRPFHPQGPLFDPARPQSPSPSI